MQRGRWSNEPCGFLALLAKHGGWVDPEDPHGILFNSQAAAEGFRAAIHVAQGGQLQ